MKKLLCDGNAFKSNYFPINECFPEFQDLCHSRRPKQKIIF